MEDLKKDEDRKFVNGFLVGALFITFLTILMVIFLILSQKSANAGEFYCTPNKDDSYTCRKVDFEIREFKGIAVAKNGIEYETTLKYQCRDQGAKGWVCLPCDKDAILMEPAKECPDSGITWDYPNMILRNDGMTAEFK